MAVMSGRIIQMRKRFYNILLQLNTPGNWKHIVEQIGPFCYTGLNGNILNYILIFLIF